MANSGSFSKTFSTGYTLLVEWTESGVDVANNQSDITVVAKLKTKSTYNINSSASKNISLTINGKKYSSTCKVAVSGGSTITLFTKKVSNITHASSGMKSIGISCTLDIAVTLSGTYVSSVSASGTATLTTIARLSTLAVAAGGTLGKEQTLTVTRLSDSFTHTIKYTCGNSSGTICTKSSAESVSFTPPLSLASENPNGTRVSIKFSIETYKGSTKIGTIVKASAITYIIPVNEVAPTVSVEVTDELGYTNSFGGYIKGKSKAKIKITATGKYGATIKSYSTNINGKIYTASEFTSDILEYAGDLEIIITVKDSRGLGKSTFPKITVLDYSTPKITALSVKRCDSLGNDKASGGYLAVRFSSAVTQLTNNSATYTIKYKKTTDSAYTTETLSDYQNQFAVSGGVFILEANTSNSYNISLSVEDAFGSGSKTAIGASVFKLFSFLARGLGMAIGKIAELQGVLDIGFKTRFSGGILNIVAEKVSDLNDLTLPNTYVSVNNSAETYANLPDGVGGTFTIEVMSAGAEGQLLQRLTTCSKTIPQTFERWYYQGGWGEWLRVSDWGGKLLWSGVYYMNENQIITLPETIDKQKTGIVLVFSRYSNGAAMDSGFNCHFVPKYLESQISNGTPCSFLMADDATFNVFGAKYLIITNSQIRGQQQNQTSGTGASGITYTNTGYVLRYVIGV